MCFINEFFKSTHVIVGISCVCGLLLGCSKADNEAKLPSQDVQPQWAEASIQQFNLQGKIAIKYPLDESLFPPEIIAPTFKWTDTVTNANRWVVQFQEGTNTLSYLAKESSWRPDAESWKLMKQQSVQQPLVVNIVGYSNTDIEKPLSTAAVRIQTSTDEVGAPIFYREVILPFIDAVIDPTKLRWRFGSIDTEEQPPIVLEGLPVCGNCHSFSQDGSLLAMDVDYANSKGSYVITRVQPEMSLNSSDIITWNDYKKEDREQTFGLLSQISPDGRYVLSTVKDKSVFVPMDGLYYSQLFFPLKGVIACYDRQNDKFTGLKGACDPKYVQSNPTWSPDGKTILFAKTETYDLKNTQGEGKTLLTRAECKEFVEDGKPFQFKIYQVPFNDGAGGESTPLPGACDDGVSSYFPKYSPDGKWIVFCKCSSYMLLRGDSKLYIMPAAGGEPRLMRCNTPEMNSWHSWSPNGKWLVFSSKANGPYTQLWLTHIDENGESTPPVVLDHFTSPDRAANIPEFVNNKADAIKKINPNFLDDISMCRAGDEFYRNGKTDQAVEKYLEALKINPNCYQAHQKLGFLYFNVLNKKEEGLKHTALALKIEPRYAMSHYDYGMANLNMGNYEMAKIHIEQAIRMVPRGIDLQYDAAEMRFQMGRAVLLSGDLDGSIVWLQNAIQINPKLARAEYLLASIYASKEDFDNAITLMQHAISVNPKVDVNPDIHARLGAHYATIQNFDLALQEAERALELARAQGKQNIIDEMEEVIPQLKQMR